jgi:hypothetical protein
MKINKRLREDEEVESGRGGDKEVDRPDHEKRELRGALLSL